MTSDGDSRSVNSSRLDLEAKLFQESTIGPVARVGAGERLSAPLIVDLDPTTFCDLACPECISGRVLNKGRFTADRLERLSVELVEAGVQGVILIGGGEPLTHQGTSRVLEVLGSAGIPIGLVTNGTLIDRHIGALSKWASWVRVSLDAGTSDTYRLFRPNRRGLSVFDRVIANMRALAEVKQGALGYSFLLMSRRDGDGKVLETNFEEVLTAGRLAKEIGCDYFELKCMFDDDHYIVEQPASLMDALGRQVDALRDLEDDTFALLGSSTLTSLREGKPPRQPKAYHKCPITELRTLITPNGVFVCPYHRGNDAARLGDVVETSFTDMWASAPTERIDPSRDCGFHCARHGSNQTILSIGDDPGKAVVVADYDPFI